MGIELTEQAKTNILKIKKKTAPNEKYLRVGLKSGGCSGFSYSYEFTNITNENDKLFKFGDLTICIDKKSYFYLNGLTIDYKEDLFKSGLEFKAPNATRSCGCGESIAFE